MLGQARGIGLTEFLHGAASETVVVLFALLTQLGDVWFLFLLGGGLYVAGEAVPRWGIDRRRGLFVLGLVFTYVALIGALKGLFLLPRPPGAGDPPVVRWIPSVLQGLFANMATAEGPGFPSGHVLGSAMVWGGIALVVEDERSWIWPGVVASVVGVVSLSRLVLGLHYLVDVVAGIAVGLGVLAVVYVIAHRGTAPTRVLLVAVSIAALGVARAGSFESVAALGSAASAWIVWRIGADPPTTPAVNRQAIRAGVAGLALGATLFGLLYALEPAPTLTWFGAAVAAGAVVGAPLWGSELGDGPG